MYAEQTVAPGMLCKIFRSLEDPGRTISDILSITCSEIIPLLQGLSGTTGLEMDRSQFAYVPRPSSQAYDDSCTPIAELHFKRFPHLQAEESPSADKDKLWSLACAFADADTEEIMEVLSEEEAAEIAGSDESGNEAEEEDTSSEVIAEEIVDLGEDEIRISKGFPSCSCNTDSHCQKYFAKAKFHALHCHKSHESAFMEP